MTTVITYGSFDLLHHGHIRLLERAKALGDYLIVGVTADDFDRIRGKINLQQSLYTRLEAVRATGIADKIIIEEYEGQKIDDIMRYNVQIFTVGSDWEGYFDYLKEYCDVVYLERTKGVSSTIIREKKNLLSLGIVGDSKYLEKIKREALHVDGIKLSGICAENVDDLTIELKELPFVTNHYVKLLENSDAVYIHSLPKKHYDQIKIALSNNKHVLCESPIAMSKAQCKELFTIARERNLVLTDSLRTAYSTAYHRLLLMIKGGKIGKVISVDAVCTSLIDLEGNSKEKLLKSWNSITAWGPTALLPVFQILGVNYKQLTLTTHYLDESIGFDAFTKISFVYENAVASIKVGNGVKSEGELIISGTKGYIYVPAPWWKMDYFEVRYENPAENNRCFYQLNGEGIRYELASFVRVIANMRNERKQENIKNELSIKSDNFYISQDVSETIAKIMEIYENRQHVFVI